MAVNTQHNQWNELRRRKQQTDEENEATDTVREIKDLVPHAKGAQVRGKHGVDTYTSFGSCNRPAFKSCSQRQSDVIRHVTALKFLGYTLREAFEDAARKFEIKPRSVENYWYQNPDGIKEADAEHLAAVLEKYHINMVRVTNMLSDAAPLAVETLKNVMKAKKASPNVKAGAARDIIKLARIEEAKPISQTENPAVEALRIARDITAIKEGNSHIVEAEDAEVVEDDEESGN